METINEKLIWKIEARLSALNRLVNCQTRIIDKKVDTFWVFLNHA